MNGDPSKKQKISLQRLPNSNEKYHIGKIGIVVPCLLLLNPHMTKEIKQRSLKILPQNPQDLSQNISK